MHRPQLADATEAPLKALVNTPTERNLIIPAFSRNIFDHHESPKDTNWVGAFVTVDRLGVESGGLGVVTIADLSYEVVS